MLLIGIRCHMTYCFVFYFRVDTQVKSWCCRLYFCYVPDLLCIKSHSALGAFLIYLKIRRVLLTSSIPAASGGLRPATNKRDQPATSFNPAAQFHCRLICGVRWWRGAQSCEATHLMVHFPVGAHAGSGRGDLGRERKWLERSWKGQKRQHGVIKGK